MRAPLQQTQRRRWLLLPLLALLALPLSWLIAPVIFYRTSWVYIEFRTLAPDGVELRWGDAPNQAVALTRAPEVTSYGLINWSGTLPAEAISTLTVRFTGPLTTVQLVNLGIGGDQYQGWNWQMPLDNWGHLRGLEPVPPVEVASLALRMTGGPAEVQLAGFKPQNQLSVVERAAAWLYSLLLLTIGLALCFGSERLIGLVPGHLPRSLQWLGIVVLRQPLGIWLLAVPATAAVAWVLVGQFVQRDQIQRPVWIQMAIDTDDSSQPAAVARYGSAVDMASNFGWQPYPQTHVAVRPLQSDQQPLQVLHIETDQGELSLDQITVPDSNVVRKDGLILPATTGAVLLWPRPSHAITLTLAPGSGRAEVRWYDQRAVVDLGNQPVRASLALPTTTQGWALLPAHEIRQLEIELPASSYVYTIRRLTVWDDPAQNWPEGKDASWTAEGCVMRSDSAGTIVKTVANQPCVIRLLGVRPINRLEPAIMAVAWLLVTALLLAILWLLTVVTARIQGRANGYQYTETTIGRWIHRRTQDWSFRNCALLAGGVAVVFHLIYALTVPIFYSTDTLVYYRNGQAFLETFRFGSMSALRTPGYPLFIATIITLFGDSVTWMVVLQHLALAALAPLTVWALAPSSNKPTALIAGILVGVAPIVSALANYAWTEALFIAFTTAALLLYMRLGDGMRSLLVVGMLVGAATMTRSNGLLLLVVLLGWILVRGWCDTRSRYRQIVALVQSSALVAGYLVIAAPWHLYLGLVWNTTDLSYGISTKALWGGAVLQGRTNADLDIVRSDPGPWSFTNYWREGATFENIVFANQSQEQTGFLAAVRRDADRSDPWALWQVTRATFEYALTLQQDQRYFYLSEATNMLTQPLRPELYRNLQPEPNDPTHQLLKNMVSRWYPDRSPARDALIAWGRFMVEHWAWLNIPAFLSLGILLTHARLRNLLPIWLYWMALVAAFSLIGFPIDRYIVVVEPLLYIVVIASLGSLVSVRYERTTADTAEGRALDQAQPKEI